MILSFKMSFHQEQTKEKSATDDEIYVGELPTGELYVGTEQPVGGFATADDANMEEQPHNGFAHEAGAGIEQQQNPLTMLPQNISDCFGHSMWDLSKTCVVCLEREYGGAVRSNLSLFRKFNCNFIRACPEHHAMVSAHFAKPEFKNIDSIPNICSQCGGEIFSDRGGFCKPCASNWLDRF